MSAPSRRLLFLLPFPPRLDGTHGGSRAIAQLVWALSKRHEVAALYLRGHDEPAMDERLIRRCEWTDEVSRDTASLPVRIARRLAPLTGVPRWAAYLWVPRFAARAREAALTWNPDVVHLEYHVMAQYAAAVADHAAPRVLTQYEPAALAAREHMAVGRGVAAIRDTLERRAWQRYERRVMADVEAVVVFTERDRQALTPLARRTPIVTIPLGSALPEQPLDPIGAHHPAAVILFIGNFRHPPNLDAAMRLVESIFPRVRTQRPQATLEIVGADAPQALRAAARDGVRVVGPVPDVIPYLDRAALVAAPLRRGGGMRVKVIEALGYGKAVVASPRALEGLTVEDGVHVVVADHDDEFVTAIVGLLSAPERRRELGRGAREWALRNLGEERWVSDYDRLYELLLSPERSSSCRPRRTGRGR